MTTIEPIYLPYIATIDQWDHSRAHMGFIIDKNFSILERISIARCQCPDNEENMKWFPNPEKPFKLLVNLKRINHNEPLDLVIRLDPWGATFFPFKKVQGQVWYDLTIPYYPTWIDDLDLEVLGLK